MRDSNHIDDVFRDSLDNLNPEQFVSDWEDMHSRLDNSGLTRKDGKKRLLIPVLLGLLAVSGWSLYIFELTDSENQIVEVVSHNTENIQPENPQLTVVKNEPEESMITPVIQGVGSEKALTQQHSNEAGSEHKTASVSKSNNSHAKGSVYDNPLADQEEMVLVETAPVNEEIFDQDKPVSGEAIIALKENVVTEDLVTEELSKAVQETKETTLANNPIDKDSKSGFYLMPYVGKDNNSFMMASTGELGDRLIERTFNPAPNSYYKNAPWIESNDLEYSAGILGGWNITEHLSVETGLLLSVKKKLNHNVSYQQVAEVVSDSSYSYNITTHQLNAEYRRNYVDIPIRLKYEMLATRQLKFYGASGLVLHSRHIYRKNGSYNYNVISNEQTMNSYGQRKFGASLLFGGGVMVKLDDEITVFAEPSYKLGLNSLVSGDLPIRHRLNTLSFGVGLMYKL